MPTIDQSDMDFVYGDDLLIDSVSTAGDSGEERMEVEIAEESEVERRKGRLEREARVEEKKCLRREARVSVELGEEEEGEGEEEGEREERTEIVVVEDFGSCLAR